MTINIPLIDFSFHVCNGLLTGRYLSHGFGKPCLSLFWIIQEARPGFKKRRWKGKVPI
jgi:hypothetical protein